MVGFSGNFAHSLCVEVSEETVLSLTVRFEP